MQDTFYFLKTTDEKIQGKRFICIHLLDFDKDTIFRIFKKYTDEDFETASNLEQFDDITNRITFAIKRDGKITLDIDL